LWHLGKDQFGVNQLLPVALNNEIISKTDAIRLVARLALKAANACLPI
jgi:hypothetical protein